MKKGQNIRAASPDGPMKQGREQLIGQTAAESISKD